jgi:hypothetical protein
MITMILKLPTFLFVLLIIAATCISRDAKATTYSCSSATTTCFDGNNGGATGLTSVSGTSDSGTGVAGFDTGSGSGGRFYNLSGSGGVGVAGVATGSGAEGVYGQTDVGYAVYGYADSSGTAIYADATSGYGLYATSSSGEAVYGSGTSGIVGIGSKYYGVYGSTSSGLYGVYGQGTNGLQGVHGSSDTGTGVYGSATGSSSYGVQGATDIGYAIYGAASGAGTGVYGSATGAGSYGIYGTDASGYAGIWGSGTSGAPGVYGNSDTGNGLKGVTGSTLSTKAGVFAENNSSGYGLYATSSSGTAVFIQGSGQYTGTWTLSSDERLKQNITPLGADALDRLLRLRGVNFEWKEPSKHGNNTGTQHGFIAQEYEKVFPEWVKTDNEGFKSIDTSSGLAAYEVEGIRELKAENDALKAQVKDQGERLERLENMQGLGHRIAWWQNPSFFGFAFGGFVIGGAIFMGVRRKRDDESKS